MAKDFTTPVWLAEDLGDVVNNSLYGNNSLNETMFNCNTDQPTLYFITQVLYALVCIVGLFGNSLVIYVVLRFSKMQTVTNMYIVNLAIADECFLIGIPFLIATMSLQLWPFGNIMCKIYMTTTSINQFTSSIFLTIMSADRYVAVCHPISAPKIRTPLISKVVSFTAWTASGFLMIPVFMYSNIENNSCNIIWPETEQLSGNTAFTLYSFVLGFAIPLMLILCFYVLVIRKLRTVGPKNKSKEKKKSHRKVTKLVLTVITVYVVCWLPYWITQVALIYTPPKACQSHFAITIFLLVGILSYSNSAMNPILYAFLSDNFKKSFLKACTCAAGKDVNAALHMENSVFPRKHNRGGSERLRTTKGTTAIICQGGAEDDHGETGPLVSKTDHSTAVTSRSTVTVTSDAKDSAVTTPVKNGVKIVVPPAEL
ncbi:somatostatin receptor type 2-like [Homalodisca vitripennis]|nr:somatostatin receptor type 2-like [Homalodisca vitripennis]XP_046680554.1 somatostatin receptor type 2-like [Homalodisca vitripennis]KAG8293817.1 somatostatin receptor activity protein [Homalodisca vitripennis]